MQNKKFERIVSEEDIDNFIGENLNMPSAYEIGYAYSANELFMLKMELKLYDNLYKQLRDTEKCIDATKKVRERILWLY